MKSAWDDSPSAEFFNWQGEARNPDEPEAAIGEAGWRNR